MESTTKIPCCPPRIKYIFPPPVDNTTKSPTPLTPSKKLKVPISPSLTDPSVIATTTPELTTSTTTQTSTTSAPIQTTSICEVNNCKKLNF